MDKSKERASQIVNNSHVIGLFSGSAQPAICAVEIHIMSTAQTPLMIKISSPPPPCLYLFWTYPAGLH